MSFRLSVLLAPALIVGLAACNDDTTETDDTGGGGGEVPAELADNLSCTDGLNAGSVCTVTGTITVDATFNSEVQWVLSGRVQIGDDGTACPTLTIEPGTTVFGATGQRSFLVIQRCAKIDAQGTADAPIVMTSGAESRAAGDWGGLVLNGYARNNLCADDFSDCNIAGEGESGNYGGDDDSDSSGTISYLTVSFAGDDVGQDDQLNGIAFQAVGNGTSVDHIQVHRNRDDGVEFFGGSVDVKYAVITGANDDSVDWTNGWTGRMQHLVVQQWDDDADRGIEGDNDEDAPTAEPRSKPTISHATFIGSKVAPEASDGLKIRRGSGLNAYSFLVGNFQGDCIDLDGDASFDWAYAGGTGEPTNFTMEGSIITDCGDLYSDSDGALFDLQVWYEDDQGNTADADGSITDYVESIEPLTNPDWTSKGDATSGGVSPSDSWFDQGTHIGGVAPGSDWTTSGWLVLDES